MELSHSKFHVQYLLFRNSIPIVWKQYIEEGALGEGVCQCVKHVSRDHIRSTRFDVSAKTISHTKGFGVIFPLEHGTVALTVEF